MRKLRLFCCLLSTLLFGSFLLSPTAQAADMLLIIDDVGNNWALGQRALHLQGPVNFAFLPFTPFASKLAVEAHRLGQGVLLHAPMANHKDMPLGPGGLYPDMNEEEFKQQLRANLASIPQVQGMNNHMGSLLTEQKDPMRWTMQVVQQQGLYFIDSLTSNHSIAFNQAKHVGVPSLKRHVFLDNDTNEKALQQQFKQAIRIAQQRGHVVLIAHPYPETLQFLEKNLPLLTPQNIQLRRLDLFFQERLWQPFRIPKDLLSKYQLQ